MVKWFGQATEIEKLRTENRRLKEQVATLEARLRAAYGEAGITALASDTPVSSAGGEAGPTNTSFEGDASELTEAELALVVSGNKIAAIKTYRDRTGADLEHAKEIIDEAAATEHVSLDLNEEELALVTNGQLFGAVKAYRDRTGVSLKKAKAAVDAAR